MELDFDKGGGLIPVIVQDWRTREVLMLAYVNQAAWQQTLQTGYAVYYSRSRRKLWKKGESSGNVQIIRDILVDCDRDTLIFMVEQVGGAACHTGHRSCFYTGLSADGRQERELFPPSFDPEQVYSKDKTR